MKECLNCFVQLISEFESNGWKWLRVRRSRRGDGGFVNPRRFPLKGNANSHRPLRSRREISDGGFAAAAFQMPSHSEEEEEEEEEEGTPPA